MKTIIDLHNKKIIVTGASSGIGRQTAILLSQIGAEVILVARNKERLEETLSFMTEAPKHTCFIADLSRLEEIELLVKESVHINEKKIDGMVYCSGVANTIPLPLMDYKRQDEDMRVNYYAFIELVKQLSKRQYGKVPCSIVGISSVSSNGGAKCQTIYSATKAAMDAAVITLSKELADKGMRLNSIRPAMIKTQMMKVWAEQKGTDYATLLDSQVLGSGEPEDVANLAAFLLSSASKFITGQHIFVDGGGPKV